MDPDEAKEAYDYELLAIISHQNNGSSIDEGHYTTCIKRNDGWWNYDDEYVTSSKSLPEYTKRS